MTDAAAPPWRRALLRWGGFAVLAASLAYLVKALAGLDFATLSASLEWRAWAIAGACSVVYAAGLSLLAQGWAVVAARGGRLPLANTVAIYGSGAVAKYLPGSLFQLATRQVMGRREGLDHAAMMHANVVDLALHLTVALALAGTFPVLGWWTPVAAAAIGLVLLAVRPRTVVVALGWQLLFFALFAAIVLVLCTWAAPVADSHRLAALFFLAWLAGLLVPVAPGGIGVREAALLALAGPYETLDTIALVALLARLVNIVGDGMFGLAGYCAATRLNRHASA